MNANWRLWRAQVGAMLRLELKRTLFSRRRWWMYLMFAAPALLTFGHSLHCMARGQWRCTIGEDGMVYAAIFQFFYLRLAIFFGCLGIFSNLFRGPVLDKTLHYYLLVPAPREVVLAGKYAAGLLAAVTLFSTSAALAFFGIFLHFGQGFRDYFWHGPGLGNLAWYLAVMALIAVVPEPVPAWLAIPGLLVVSLLVLIYAASKVRKIEVSYSE